jgi:hypothetical protein
MLDDFGDEWHTMTVADDDQFLCDKYNVNGACGTWRQENWASDGKTWLFVVNPKTPAIWFTTVGPSAQFYTTPAKMYYVPKIFAQTTYLTDDVEIALANVTNSSPIYYKIDSGSFQTYRGPISSNALSNGTHILEYYFGDAHHKVRKLVKNPAYPSDLDTIQGKSGYKHGYLMWKNDAELAAIVSRNIGASARAPYTTAYKWAHTSGSWGGAEQDSSDSGYRKGLRGTGDRYSSLQNALFAVMEGYDAKLSGHLPFAQYAKRFLLDTVRTLDPTGIMEAEGGSIPNPGQELNNEGYYEINNAISDALAYDLIISKYRTPTYADGITPIEDFRIRDVLARASVEAFMHMGLYTTYASANSRNGMSGAAAEFGALITALAMPSYSTPYYGTSGFDGNTTTYPWTPYPDHGATWKDALYLVNTPIYSFPNQSVKFGLDEMIFPTSMLRSDGKTLPAGSFSDRPGYYSILLMGRLFQTMANVVQIALDHSYPYLEMSFDYSNKGTMYSYIINASEDAAAYHYPQLLMVNEHFPTIAQGADDYLKSQGTGDDGLDNQFYLVTPLGMVFYRDDWANVVTR